jgi:hypothetical protein
LANRLFGALFGSNYSLQTPVVWLDLTLQGGGADSRSTASTPAAATTLRFQIETDAGWPKSSDP